MELSDGAKAALSKVVESSATALADAMDSSGKMVKDNVKELAHEIILFKGYIDHAMASAFATIAIVACGRAISWLYAGTAEMERENRGVTYIGISILSIITFFMFCWLADSITTILKAKFAPRLFLTEYAIGMMKKESSSDKK